MLNKKIKIGFIGIGVMGKSMATHILNSGLDLYVYNRTKTNAESLLDKGAIWKETVAQLAAQVDVIISIVGYPKDVEKIYFGNEGIINNARPGSTLIDMTTSKPSLAKQIYKQAKVRGINALDAPVSGGDVGAKNASLTIMVGGDQEIFEKMKPIFNLMGKNIILQGGAGAGQHTKMCNQIVIASNMIGACEAMVYAKRAGLGPESVLKSIESGAAGSWSLSNLAPKMLSGDFKPGFYVKHFVKDMNIALSEAKSMGLNTPGLELSKSLYDQLVTDGKENNGTQILYQLLDK